ncbi:unnamed protein product [Peniophora sp. CBMAI 1063]|nr:unnamed protein product [Peniophora sp. CBMAI 1063]
MSTKDVYMVIGGSGFLGRHIVKTLLGRGESVSVFDIVQQYDDTPFYSGDISNKDQVSAALATSGATCIFHTASPHQGAKGPVLFKVNVQGTNAVIAAAVANNVRKLVYTSSAGVPFDGHDIIDGDERLPYPAKPIDPYTDSKAQAEQIVLEANGKGGLLTVAIRPAGIFGPGDKQMLVGTIKALREGKSHVQIGSNTNLFDMTYVDNMVHAHILAAEKLSPPEPYDIDKVRAQLTRPLGFVDASTPRRRIPTSAARPLGPYVERPPNADALEAAWRAPPPPRRAPERARFDPLSDAALARADKNPLQVAGSVFFISNGEPVYFWDLMRAIWRAADPEHYPSRKVVVIPRSLGVVLASVTEGIAWITGRDPLFTRFRVAIVSAHRWHNIERARRALGYEPIVGLDEGIRRSMEWWHAEEAKAASRAA